MSNLESLGDQFRALHRQSITTFEEDLHNKQAEHRQLILEQAAKRTEGERQLVRLLQLPPGAITQGDEDDAARLKRRLTEVRPKFVDRPDGDCVPRFRRN